MAEELGLSISLNQDYVEKYKDDHQLKGMIELWPNADLFNNQSQVGAHIILLLDSSGSMNQKIVDDYSKREAVIDGATSLLPYLTVDDKVSVISYNTQAIVVEREVSGNNKNEIESAIKEISNHSGGTNFEAAMKSAQKLAKQENTHIIFFTDGRSYQGDDQVALKIAKELGQQGVTINAMGLGNDFKFDFMYKFSSATNGITEDLTAKEKKVIEKDSQKFFTDMLQKAQRAVISNLFLNIHFPSGLRDVEFYQQLPEKRNHNSRIREQKDYSQTLELRIGNLVQGKKNTYVFALNLDTTDESSMKLADLQLSYSVPTKNLTDEKEERAIYLNLGNDSSEMEYDPYVEDAYSDVSLLNLWDEFENLYHAGEFVKAGKQLKVMIEAADQIGDFEAKKIYKERLERLKAGEELSQADLNAIQNGSVTSQADDNISMVNNNDDISDMI